MTTLKKITKLRAGGTVNISLAEIVNAIINLPDAKKNLTEEQYSMVKNLYTQYREFSCERALDFSGYCKIAIEIIKDFDKIAPYEKYSGADENESFLMMEDIRIESIVPSHDVALTLLIMQEMKNASIKKPKKKHRLAKIMVYLLIGLSYGLLDATLGITLGAIPTFIVVSFLFFIAKQICKSIDLKNSVNIPQVYILIIITLLFLIIPSISNLENESYSEPSTLKTDSIIAKTESNSNASRDSTIQDIVSTIDDSLKEQFTGENLGDGWYDVEYQETGANAGITIKLWFSGMFEIADAARNGDSTYKGIWEDILEYCVETWNIYDSAIKSILDDVNVRVVLANDKNTDQALVIIKNGQAFLDYTKR